MEKDILPSSEDAVVLPEQHPPFYQNTWEPPAKWKTVLHNGVTLTIRLTPYAIMIWVFAPDKVKYLAKDYARYIPYATRYLIWWLKQKDF